MRPPRPLPEHLDRRPFSRGDAIAVGLTDRRLRAGDLTIPFYGVRMRASAEPTVENLATAYAARMQDLHAFSHATAALLHGLPLPLRFGPLPLHVSCPAPHRPARGRDIAGHSVRAENWSTAYVALDRSPDATALLPLTAGHLTWISLAPHLGIPDLVALGDAMLTGGQSTLGELREVIERHAGDRGVARARAALPLLRAGALSRPETLLRLQIGAAGLPEPQVNVAVEDRNGRRLFRPDLSWPAYRVLVEYEGDHHRVSRAQFRFDIDRMEAFADGGWTGLRATGDDVFLVPDRFLARLHRRLTERGLAPRRLRHVPAAGR